MTDFKELAYEACCKKNKLFRLFPKDKLNIEVSNSDVAFNWIHTWIRYKRKTIAHIVLSRKKILIYCGVFI